jgi:signal peptide peptidase SppA
MRKSNPGTRRDLPHIADRLFDSPLLVHPRKLRSIVGVLGLEMGIGSYLASEIVEAAEDDFLVGHETAALPAGSAICVIPIHGTLVQRGGGMDAMSGLRSYESICSDLREALADDAISAILLDVDSGGGEVAGCFDLAAEIAAATEKKPVYAFANESAYSAAYALASAADRLFVARTGGVGSIGVVAVHTDQSAFDKELGISYTPIFAGARKIDGWPHGPLSDEAKREFQTFVDRSYRIFVETVAANRGIAKKDVVDTQAACFTAEDAIQAGLADGIATFDEVIGIIAEDLKELSAQEFPGQGGREAFSGPAGEHTAKETSIMKRLFGKRSEESAPVDEKEEQAAGKPAAPGTGKQKGDASPADNDQEQYAADPAEDESEDPSEDDEEGDGKDAKKKAAAAKRNLSGKEVAEEAAKITDLCTLFGNPGLASGYIRKGVSSSAVQRHLLKMRNEDADAQQAAGGTVSTAHTGERAKPKRLVEGMQELLKTKGLA